MRYEQMQLAELNELAKLAIPTIFSYPLNKISDAVTEIRYSIVWAYHDIFLTIGYYFAKQLQKQRRQEYTETTLKCLFGIKEGA